MAEQNTYWDEATEETVFLMAEEDRLALIAKLTSEFEEQGKAMAKARKNG